MNEDKETNHLLERLKIHFKFLLNTINRQISNHNSLDPKNKDFQKSFNHFSKTVFDLFRISQQQEPKDKIFEILGGSNIAKKLSNLKGLIISSLRNNSSTLNTFTKSISEKVEIIHPSAPVSYCAVST